MATALIGLGANLDDREETLRRAFEAMGALGRVTAVSSLYESVPVGFRAQPLFLNAALALETRLSPRDLMAGLLAIEERLGRTRSFPNAPRTLDLDLLLMDDQVSLDPSVTLPHPRFHERAFVLVPLAEIAPAANHPRLLLTIEELLNRLPTTDGVALMRNQGWELADPPRSDARTE